MKKDKIFLESLEENLKELKVNTKDIEAIVTKYRDFIIEEKSNKKKIKYIIKDLGDPKDVALKEKKLLKKKKNTVKDKTDTSSFKGIFIKIGMVILTIFCKIGSFLKNVFVKIGHGFKRFYYLISKDINYDMIKEYFRNKKQNKKDSKIKSKKDKTKKEKVKSEKKSVKNKLIKEKEKQSFLSRIKIFFANFSSKFKRKNKKIKEKRYEQQELEFEEFKDEIDSSEDNEKAVKVVTEENVYVKNFALKSILLVIFFLLFIVCSILTVACLFSILDGIRLFGLSIGLISLTLLVLLFVVKFYLSLFGKNINYIVMLVLIVLFIGGTALGIGDFVHEIYNLEVIDDVSDKYSMTNKLEIYNIPENKNMYLFFNSNYNTQYIINYDKNLKDKVKVSVQYYECYYDYYIKKSSNNIYISLKPDKKDRISTYIDDMKDGKIYNNDELARYVVTISINEADKDRLVID